MKRHMKTDVDQIHVTDKRNEMQLTVAIILNFHEEAKRNVSFKFMIQFIMYRIESAASLILIYRISIAIKFVYNLKTNFWLIELRHVSSVFIGFVGFSEFALCSKLCIPPSAHPFCYFLIRWTAMSTCQCNSNVYHTEKKLATKIKDICMPRLPTHRAIL